MTRIPTKWWPSVIGVILAGLFAWSYFRPLGGDDLGWHLRVGDYVRSQLSVPHVNPFTWTAAGHEFHAHEWLSGVVFSLVNDAFGVRGLLLLRAAVFVLTVGLLYLLARRRGSDALVAGVVLFVCGWVVSLNASLRPWLFSNLFFVIELWLLEYHRSSRKLWPLAALPVLFAVWVNIHGSFVFGGLIFGVVLLVDVWRDRTLVKRVGVVFVAALAATLVSPYGAQALWFPVQYGLGTGGDNAVAIAQRAITEWLPMFEQPPQYVGWWVVLVLAAGIALAFNRSTRRDPRAWLGLGMLALSLHQRRHVVLAAILLAAPLAQAFTPWARRSAFWLRQSAVEAVSRRRGFVPVLCLVLTVCVAADLARPDFSARRMAHAAYPMEAFDRLNELEPSRLFNLHELGGPLAWYAPQHRLFVIPVHDAMPREVMISYLRIAHLEEGWQQTLDSYDVDQAILPSHHPLADALLDTGEWTAVHTDDYAVLLVKDPVTVAQK